MVRIARRSAPRACARSLARSEIGAWIRCGTWGSTATSDATGASGLERSAAASKSGVSVHASIGSAS